jgi:hypothetical protein
VKYNRLFDLAKNHNIFGFEEPHKSRFYMSEFDCFGEKIQDIYLQKSVPLDELSKTFLTDYFFHDMIKISIHSDKIFRLNEKSKDYEGNFEICKRIDFLKERSSFDYKQICFLCPIENTRSLMIKYGFPNIINKLYEYSFLSHEFKHLAELAWKVQGIIEDLVSREKYEKAGLIKNWFNFKINKELKKENFFRN